VRWIDRVAEMVDLEPYRLVTPLMVRSPSILACALSLSTCVLRNDADG
jgi:hypothetical protein